MLSTYCQDCGAKNEYRFEKPNFCCSCGSPLSGSAKKTKIPVPKETVSRARQEADDLDEEGSDVYEIPDIGNFEYEIEVSNASFRMGSLFNDMPIEEPIKATKKRGRPRKK